MLIMADKTSNLRSMLSDYKQIGEELWKRFNKPVQMQAWYYSKVIDALYDMQHYSECAPVYWEMVGLFKDVFVKYYLDVPNQMLIQVCLNDEKYYLLNGDPEWKVFENELSDTVQGIGRHFAEALEDNWNAMLWEHLLQQMKKGEYDAFS